MVKNVDIIGTTQTIQIKTEGDKDVVAKIDTGADTSSVWASSIFEKDGALHFKLFSPKSVYYSGKEHVTSDYKVSFIKNSFGHGEYRYKVKLRVKINNKLYNVTFSLADRSNSMYPVLIGKRFLKNKFVVDVSKTHNEFEDTGKPVVVLVTKVTDKIEGFFNEVSKNLSSKLILTSYSKLLFEINEFGGPSIKLPDGDDIANAKIVYFKSHSLYPEQALAVARYLQYKHVAYFDKELAGGVSRSKLSELFTLASNGIPVPQTLIVTGAKNVPTFNNLFKKFGGEFVVKDAFADRGKNNYLVSDKETFDAAMERLNRDKVKLFIVQDYIENDGFLRVLLFGRDVAQLIFRKSVNHKDYLRNHLNKPQGGMNAIELNKEDCVDGQIALAQRSSLAMARDVSGVDLIQDIMTKKWYVLEVNYNPEMVGGVDSVKKAESMAKFLKIRVKEGIQ